MTVGDYDVRSLSAEQVFALTPLPDNCVDAANRAARRFDSGFPGWQLYCRIVRGESIFDRQIMAWAISSARMYSRMRKRNGQCVVRKAARGRWIAQAGADALDALIFGRRVESTSKVAHLLDVDDELYERFRLELLGLMALGFSGYVAEVHYQLYRVRLETLRAA